MIGYTKALKAIEAKDRIPTNFYHFTDLCVQKWDWKQSNL